MQRFQTNPASKHSDSSHLLYLNLRSDTAKGLLFGLRIPFLPDFLLDHTLLGKEPSERIREHSRRWTQFVSGLWRTTEDVTYALRFDLNQNHKSVDTYILGRLQTQKSLESINQAQILLTDLQRMLESFGFEPKLMTGGQLQSLLDNSTHRYCFEVCQEEVATPIRQDVSIAGERGDSNTDAEFSIPQEFIYLERRRKIYGIRPWWGSGGTFLVPFSTIASQNSSVSVCILLAPTTLKLQEQDLIAAIARQAESLAQRQTKGSYFKSPQVNPSQNKTDPQLRWESRLYAANLRRLNYPFLTTILCFSDDKSAAQQVASAFSSTIREERSYENPVGESENFSSGAKIHSWNNHIDPQQSYQHLNFTPLLVSRNRENLPHNSLQRLRYLMDGRGATSAFRFPVSVEGGVPGIPVKQRPPDFHPGPRNELIPTDAIDLGRFHVGGRAFVHLKDFTKHALITGFTGSGKTNTVLYLLDQFWHKNIPFLVIESAKKEYRGLRHVSHFKNSLRIYTLGNETVFPLRFNPFQLVPGVRLEAHLAKLQTCFEAALPPVGPLSSVITEALDLLYQNKGWKLVDTAKENDRRSFPTMKEFYEIVEKVLDNRNYVGEIKSNVEAAIKGRIKPLLFGSKGKMFSQEISTPSAKELFSNPVILELNDLNEQDKSLVMMFFLTLLREYRELHTDNQLLHITVVEEAHNVVGNFASKGNEDTGSSDIQAKAVQAFCNMLAEVRSYGEGLIIADQSPEKLARDAMRNTNVQIAHQLRDFRDREAIANATIMSDEQRDFLGKCQTGRAAIFYTGLEKATFIDVPIYKEKSSSNESKAENKWCGFRDSITPQKSDTEVRNYMSRFKAFDCLMCRGSPLCNYHDWVKEAIDILNPYIPKYLKTQQDNENSEYDRFIQLIIQHTRATKQWDNRQLDLVCCCLFYIAQKRPELACLKPQEKSRLIQEIKANLK